MADLQIVGRPADCWWTCTLLTDFRVVGRPACCWWTCILLTDLRVVLESAQCQQSSYCWQVFMLLADLCIVDRTAYYWWACCSLCEFFWVFFCRPIPTSTRRQCRQPRGSSSLPRIWKELWLVFLFMLFMITTKMRLNISR